MYGIKKTNNLIQKADVVAQKGHDIAILMKNGQNILTHADQFRSRMGPEDIEMKGESEIAEHKRKEGIRESCS